ncbi:quinol dehydrogenase ferredoxin subunit NapH [Hyphomicrobium sp. 99]|uniref:quinol dehydrogenase ferredoxin subunit NapH n=1 Tax=Hyphomicrobium sp. 99 TaxID=1163419 RepID=UPI001FDA1BF1|nr:quinol dehydrogenase ferredoxin subunit NapH [Hyphomicrobium sp. 99]
MMSARRPILWLTSDGRKYAAERRGWLFAHRYWMARRASQILLLALFALGPWTGIWIARGNFASSQILGVVPLSDPFIFLQSLVAGHKPYQLAFLGAGIIATLYWLVGGRVYCSWVCPVNVVTDAAYWLRDKVGLTRDRKLDKRTRVLIMLAALMASFLSGTIAWEFVNPVSILQRAFIFGIGAGWGIIAVIFALDLFVTRRGWCSHLCPVGAFYGVIGSQSVVRISASKREACTDCGACFRVCPEPHVITPALKGTGTHLIVSGDCTNCASCIDACYVDVFDFRTRLSKIDSGQDVLSSEGHREPKLKNSRPV